MQFNAFSSDLINKHDSYLSTYETTLNSLAFFDDFIFRFFQLENINIININLAAATALRYLVSRFLSPVILLSSQFFVQSMRLSFECFFPLVFLYLLYFFSFYIIFFTYLCLSSFCIMRARPSPQIVLLLTFQKLCFCVSLVHFLLLKCCLSRRCSCFLQLFFDIYFFAFQVNVLTQHTVLSDET